MIKLICDWCKEEKPPERINRLERKDFQDINRLICEDCLETVPVKDGVKAPW